MQLDNRTRTATLALGALGLLILGGATVAAFRSPATPAPVAVQPLPVAPAPVAVQAAPAATTVPVVVAPTTERVRVVQRQPKRYVKKRSGKKSALIIGGSAVGGALVGKVVGGKKSTIIGGLAGAAAGTIYDRKTRKKNQ
jgi:uncharacterized protein YcfJ